MAPLALPDATPLRAQADAEVPAPQDAVVDLTASARSDSVGRALRRAAALWGDRSALRYRDRSWSFSELDCAADKVANWLVHDLQARPGDRVACYGRNSDAYFLAWLGCVRAGLIHVPLNYALTAGERYYLLRQSGSHILLHDESLKTGLDADNDLGLKLASLDADRDSALMVAMNSSRISPCEYQGVGAEIAQIMYTSGTTSAPKGAMMSHGAILAQYASAIGALDFAPGDRCLAALPLYHTAQMPAFTMPQMLAGASTLLIDAPLPSVVLGLIERERITSFFAPPTVWISLLQDLHFARYDLTSLRKLYYGASIMPEPVLRELLERLPYAGLYNVYGQTEIAPIATVLRPEEHAARPTSVGRPVLNVLTRVVDEQMVDVAPGKPGEIVHRSPQLCSGYWEDPAETEKAFAGGWFHSGDVGYRDDDGYLHVMDRLRDVINTGGVLVAGREVEDAIFRHPAVREVAVIGMPHPKWIEAITAIVVRRRDMTCTEQEIIQHVRTQLAAFKVPKAVRFVEELPKNASGKILKRELRLSVDCREDAV